MTPEAFIKAYLPHAKAVEASTGLSALAILTQAALESSWGNVAPGNNFFGIKDLDGKVNGNEQLVTTTEFMATKNAKFPVILKITQQSARLFKYLIKDYFATFKTPTEAFQQHAIFLQKNPRYKYAWSVRHNPAAFLTEVAKAGYATSPTYATTLLAVLHSINIRMPK